RSTGAILSLVVACLLVAAGLEGRAVAAYGTAPGFAATDFATGFVNNGSIGPIGIAADPSGNLFVGDNGNGFVYKFGPSGGVASAATQLNATAFIHPHGLAFGKDGSLFLNLFDDGKLVQIDPVTGAVVRIVASGIASASALATDPLSGDLFV